MRWIIAWSMKFRLVVIVAAALLMFFGISQLQNLPVDTLPEFSRPYVEVQTEALGLSAAEVEAMITVPLEADMLNGVPWVEEIRSESIPGLSSIVLFFEPGTEMLTARQLVQEHLVAVHALPNVSKPPAMLQPVSSANRFMAVSLTSDELSLIDMSVLSRWTIVPRLMGLPGVAQVSIWGQRKRQLQVQVDPERLRDKGVTLQQIVNTTGNALWVSPLSYLKASTPGTGGWIETPNQRLGIQHLLPISTPADLAKVTVEGTSMSLGDLTTVVEDHQPLIGDALVDDAPALMLVIEKFPWANTVDVTAAVEDAVAALAPGLSGVKMDTTTFRPATYLELAMGNLSTAYLLGTVLLAVALFLAFFNWRTALISVIAVVISALAAVSVLYLSEVTVNMVVLGGLMAALLVLIDDAVIDPQNIARRLRDNPQENDARATGKIIYAAALEMRRPIVYATVIIALALVPLMFMNGMADVFSKPIVFSYGLALLASFATALTVTPVLSVFLLRKASSVGGGSPLLQALQRGFDGILARTNSASSSAIAAGVGVLGAIVIGGFWVMPMNIDSILPTFQERDVLITVDGEPGTSEHAMRRTAAQISGSLRSIPGVRAVSAHVGRAVMSDAISDINGGEVWVSIDRTADYEATTAAIRETVADYPGFDIDVDTFLSERLKDEVTSNGNSAGLVVRVYGEDLEKLRTKAEEVRQVVASVEGIVAPEVQYPHMQPNLEIETKLADAKQYGLKPGDVRRATAILLSGIEVGSLFEEQKVFDVVVWGTPEIRHSLSSVDDLLIDTPSGGHVRLMEVADTRIAPQPTVINREAVARHIDVEADVQGRNLAAVSADVTARLREDIKFPLEYRAEVLGDQVAAAKSTVRAQAIGIAAAIGIFLLLQAAFGSWSLAFFVFLSLPVSLLGGVATAFAFGEIAALGSLLGFLAVFGIALRNAMTLIAHYRHLEQQGEAFSPELVLRGTRERLAPIVMTALVAALAFLPFLWFGNIAGLEILQPMAIAVIGGLVSATLVNLLVIPVLYLGFGAGAEPLELISEEKTTFSVHHTG